MSIDQITLITQQLQQAQHIATAGQALVDGLSAYVAPCYLGIQRDIFTPAKQTHNAQFLHWLKKRENWQQIKAPIIDDGALFVPLHFGGRLQGMLIVDSDEAHVSHAITLGAILATRLDEIITAQLIQHTRQLALKITQALTVADVLKIAVENIPALFDCRNAVIYKFEPDDLRGEVLAEYPTKVAFGYDMGIHNYTLFTSAFSEAGIVIGDASETSITTQAMKNAMRTSGIVQYLSAPMIESACPEVKSR